jgi:hypothetical protein
VAAKETANSLATTHVTEMRQVLCSAGKEAVSREWVVGEIGLEPTKASATDFNFRYVEIVAGSVGF